MVLQELEDRLYTSTEVANILGVSLRSVYRYLEDGKLKAEMKTATGRHRFTKQNIVDFLSPQPKKEEEKKVEPSAEEPAPAVTPPAVVETPEPAKTEAAPAVEAAPEPAAPVEEEKEDVDWLSKFRQAAEKYKIDQDEAPAEPSAEEPAAPAESVSGLTDAPKEETTAEEVTETSPSHYYKSAVGGLKDIAQNIDKSAKKASLEYAFTMDAGLSLHKPISPFSLIHAYVRSEDLAFFEKILDLSPVEVSEAQLCLVVSDDTDIYAQKKEVHGLNVVSDERLKTDLTEAGKTDLVKELS